MSDNISDLYGFIEQQLPVFDEILAGDQTPLHERPLVATLFFIQYCIINIKIDNKIIAIDMKEDFFEHKWFKIIYKLIKKWYRDRYADAINPIDNDFALGVVLIYDTPFQLKIPLTIAEEKESDYERWFCFPNSVLENENVLDWFTNKPNFDRIREDDLESLRNEVNYISSSTRAIRINLMASIEKQLHKIPSSILSHIDKAVQDILSLDIGRISTSFWEIHLAIEKAIKLIILQNGYEHKNMHNLNKLCKIANNIDGIEIDCRMFAKFPSDIEAIKQRYGEGITFTMQQAVKNYSYAIEVIAKLTELLKRKFVFNNARFLLRFAPWER